MHSMSFVSAMSILVIYGGKYESESETRYLDDLNVLNLATLEWFHVNLVAGERRPPRAMHSACVNRR